MARKIFKVLGILLLTIAVIVAGFCVFVLAGKEETNQLVIGDMHVDTIADGIYTGEYNGFRWSNSVEVTVEQHRITDIKLLKKQVFAKDETMNTLIDSVKEKQSLQVDVVTGASIDSKALLRSIENALQNPPKEQ